LPDRKFPLQRSKSPVLSPSAKTIGRSTV